MALSKALFPNGKSALLFLEICLGRIREPALPICIRSSGNALPQIIL